MMLSVAGLRSMLFCLTICSTLCVGSRHPEDWLVPKQLSTVVVGQTVRVQWTSNLWTWISKDRLPIDSSYADLWVCGYYYTDCAYQHFIAQVNISGEYRMDWRVLIPNEELRYASDWIHVFVADGENPRESLGSLSGAWFFIAGDAATTVPVTSSVTSSATDSVQSTVSSIAELSTITPQLGPTTTADVRPTSDTTSISSPSPIQPVSMGLTKSVIGGIAAGSVFGAMGLIALGWLLAHWKNSRTNTEMDQQEGGPTDNGAPLSSAEEAKAAMESSAVVPELVGSAAQSHPTHQSQHWNSPAELIG